MFLCVVLQVVPELVAERVFGVDLLFENVGKNAFRASPRHALRGRGWEFEGEGVLESDDENAFAMLGDKTLSIDNLCVNIVTKPSKRIHDHEECPPLVMAPQVLHVLEDKSFRLVVLDDVAKIEE